MPPMKSLLNQLDGSRLKGQNAPTDSMRARVRRREFLLVAAMLTPTLRHARAQKTGLTRRLAPVHANIAKNAGTSVDQIERFPAISRY